MFAVIFEVEPAAGRQQEYLDIAAALRPELDKIDGFISIERFSSLTNPGKILSLSFWRDEAALIQWRQHEEHHRAQWKGRSGIFQGLSSTHRPRWYATTECSIAHRRRSSFRKSNAESLAHPV